MGINGDNGKENGNYYLGFRGSKPEKMVMSQWRVQCRA